jgi:hypothetical protein
MAIEIPDDLINAFLLPPGYKCLAFDCVLFFQGERLDAEDLENRVMQDIIRKHITCVFGNLIEIKPIYIKRDDKVVQAEFSITATTQVPESYVENERKLKRLFHKFRASVDGSSLMSFKAGPSVLCFSDDMIQRVEDLSEECLESSLDDLDSALDHLLEEAQRRGGLTS